LNFLRHLNRDRLGALLLILIGSGVVVQGTGYRMGTLTHMGAGFMPVVYGTLMTCIGIVLGVTAQRGPDAVRRKAEWRGWFCIVGGVAAFVVLGHWGGLAPATFAAVFISALGDRHNSLRDAALLALLMVVAGTLIFNVGLHLQLPLFGWGV